MFRFADRGLVWWPVQIRPGDEASTVHLQYRVLTRAELREQERKGYTEMLAKLKTDGPAKDEAALIELFEASLSREADIVAMLLDRITGWRDIVDASDAPEPFTRDKLQAFLDIDYMFKPALLGLFEASRAGPSKNLQPGPAGTPGQVQA